VDEMGTHICIKSIVDMHIVGGGQALASVVKDASIGRVLVSGSKQSNL
jgi:hypothetical protein